MKKIIFILLMIFTISVLLTFCYKQVIHQPTQDDQVTNQRINEIISQLEKYKQKEQEDKLRKAELLAMQNPEIITKEFANVGFITTYVGKVNYSDILQELRWYGTKEIKLDLHYKFGFGIDINKIIVNSFYDKTVILEIPKQEIKLQYIELIPNECTINGTKTWLVSNYTPNEVKILLESAYSQIKERVESNKDIINMAIESLKANLKNIIFKLGYEDVVFVES